MKEFLKKNLIFVLIVVVLILFIVGTILVNKFKKVDKDFNYDVNEWLLDSEGNEPVVTVFCDAISADCMTYKDIMKSIYNEYDFNLYWVDVKPLVPDTKSIITESYELEGYNEDMYMFIVQDGEFVTYYQNEWNKRSTIKFLEEYEVI